MKGSVIHYLGSDFINVPGVCAAETSEGKDLGMAAGGYAVQAGTLKHAAQKERGREHHVGVHGVGAAWGSGELGATRVNSAAGGAGA